MRLTFEKMHGLGNDFIVIEDFEHAIDLSKEQVKALCDRNFGIGADGVILLRSAADEACDYGWWFANADGSSAQMCGNGIRCAARALYEKGRLASGTPEVTLETVVGPRHVTIKTDEEGAFYGAIVAMGRADFSAEAIATSLEPNTLVEIECDGQAPLAIEGIIEYPLTIDELGIVIPITCLSMGNPHTVIDCTAFGCAIEDAPVGEVGPLVEGYSAFGERTNVVFVEVVDEHTLNVRVWERGCGETLACGTGACAAAVASLIQGHAGESMTVRLVGGDLQITVDPQTLAVSMAGPAELVYSGTIDLNE